MTRILTRLRLERWLAASPRNRRRYGLFFVAAFALQLTSALADPALEPVQTSAPVVTAASAGPLQDPGKLVIIIDDLGHVLSHGQRAAELPGPVTLSILPYTRHGDRIARQAHQAGKEIMLHAPMSNLRNHPLGAGGLTPDMNEQEFRATFAASLLQIPHVQGVNNHMGSELTQYRPQMRWLMEELLEEELYFVDSRTSSDTVAASMAAELGIPHLSRHVFLDNDPSREAIDERFNVAIARARKDGLAVAIGHPYKETLDYLADRLPTLGENNITLLGVSEALPVEQTTPAPEEPVVLVPIANSVLAESTDSRARHSLTSTPRSAM